MKRSILLILIVVLVFVGCAEKGDSKDDVVKSTEVLNAISDLEVLIKSAEKIHPDMYKYTDKEAFTQKSNEIKDQFITGEQVEFYRLAAPLFASLKDGQTVIEPLADYFIGQIKNGDRFFPYQVMIKNNKIYAEASYIGSKEIEIHSEIVSINDQPVIDLLETLKVYISGLTQAEVEAELVKEFHRLYYVVYGNSETFKITYIEAGESKEVIIQGASLDNIVLLPLPEGQTHTYDSVGDGVGLISIYKFDGFSSFKRFIEATFKKIEKNPVDTLIIDISDNIGGNTEYSKYLMSSLTDKPFRLYGKIEAKISEAALTEDSYMEENFSDRIGEIINAEFNEESRPYQDVKPFDGKVYVAISNNTFNTASEFAAMVKDYEVATLIGKATGTNPSGFKSLHFITGDHLDIRLAVPYQFFARPSGKDTEMGVQPDIEVDGDIIQYILDNKN